MDLYDDVVTDGEFSMHTLLDPSLSSLDDQQSNSVTPSQVHVDSNTPIHGNHNLETELDLDERPSSTLQAITRYGAAGAGHFIPLKFHCSTRKSNEETLTNRSDLISINQLVPHVSDTTVVSCTVNQPSLVINNEASSNNPGRDSDQNTILSIAELNNKKQVDKLTIRKSMSTLGEWTVSLDRLPEDYNQMQTDAVLAQSLESDVGYNLRSKKKNDQQELGEPEQDEDDEIVVVGQSTKGKRGKKRASSSKVKTAKVKKTRKMPSKIKLNDFGHYVKVPIITPPQEDFDARKYFHVISEAEAKKPTNSSECQLHFYDNGTLTMCDWPKCFYCHHHLVRIGKYIDQSNENLKIEELPHDSSLKYQRVINTSFPCNHHWHAECFSFVWPDEQQNFDGTTGICILCKYKDAGDNTCMENLLMKSVEVEKSNMEHEEVLLFCERNVEADGSLLLHLPLDSSPTPNVVYGATYFCQKDESRQELWTFLGKEDLLLKKIKIYDATNKFKTCVDLYKHFPDCDEEAKCNRSYVFNDDGSLTTQYKEEISLLKNFKLQVKDVVKLRRRFCGIHVPYIDQQQASSCFRGDEYGQWDFNTMVDPLVETVGYASGVTTDWEIFGKTGSSLGGHIEGGNAGTLNIMLRNDKRAHELFIHQTTTSGKLGLTLPPLAEEEEEGVKLWVTCSRDKRTQKIIQNYVSALFRSYEDHFMNDFHFYKNVNGQERQFLRSCACRLELLHKAIFLEESTMFMINIVPIYGVQTPCDAVYLTGGVWHEITNFISNHVIVRNVGTSDLVEIKDDFTCVHQLPNSLSKYVRMCGDDNFQNMNIDKYRQAVAAMKKVTTVRTVDQASAAKSNFSIIPDFISVTAKASADSLIDKMATTNIPTSKKPENFEDSTGIIEHSFPFSINRSITPPADDVEICGEFNNSTMLKNLPLPYFNRLRSVLVKINKKPKKMYGELHTDFLHADCTEKRQVATTNLCQFVEKLFVGRPLQDACGIGRFTPALFNIEFSSQTAAESFISSCSGLKKLVNIQVLREGEDISVFQWSERWPPNTVS